MKLSQEQINVFSKALKPQLQSLFLLEGENLDKKAFIKKAINIFRLSGEKHDVGLEMINVVILTLKEIFPEMHEELDKISILL